MRKSFTHFITQHLRYGKSFHLLMIKHASASQVDVKHHLNGLRKLFSLFFCFTHKLRVNNKQVVLHVSAKTILFMYLKHRD